MVDCKRFDRLRLAHKDLLEDFTALFQCLEAAGFVHGPDLHRMRFEAARRRCPIGQDHCLEDALLPLPLRLALECCGERKRGALLGLREASRGVLGRVDAVRTHRLYVCGSVDAASGDVLTSVERLDPHSGAWEPAPPMLRGRVGCAGGVLAGRLYVCGGSGDHGMTAERYNPAWQRWEVVPPMSTRRFEPAAAVLGMRLFICGGEDDAGNVHHSVERFSPHAAGGRGAWEVLPALMSTPRHSFAAAAMAGQEELLVVCGGTAVPFCQRHTGPVPHDSAEALDLGGGGTWRDLPLMRSPRLRHVAATLRGSVYACGGSLGDGRGLASVERWGPEAQVWSALPPMGLERGEPAAAVIAGRLYVLGGTSSEPNVERFSPASGTWEAVPSTLQGEQFLCAGAVWSCVPAA
mmetsp:Transcript_66516/g.194653  ORF Transcript_66516/g.194653 Transcript_66516/m.194653 type:complete len:407 (-) Transcript_66516:75-1295(-)